MDLWSSAFVDWLRCGDVEMWSCGVVKLLIGGVV